MDPDTHSGPDGKYEVHSLYFDDYQDTCAADNDAGVSERTKYRIRYYGDRPSHLHLERKEKLHGRCRKESCSLTLDQYRMLVNGDADELLWDTENALLRQFCTLCMTKRFAPRIVIDYERTAYVEEVSNIRITLDENISASWDWRQFLTGDYLRYPIQERGQHVLEVKFDEILPAHIPPIINGRELIQTSFSKYYLGRKRLLAVMR